MYIHSLSNLPPILIARKHTELFSSPTLPPSNFLLFFFFFLMHFLSFPFFRAMNMMNMEWDLFFNTPYPRIYIYTPNADTDPDADADPDPDAKNVITKCNKTSIYLQFPFPSLHLSIFNSPPHPPCHVQSPPPSPAVTPAAGRGVQGPKGEHSIPVP